MRHRRASPVLIGAFVVGGLAILTAGVLLVGSGRLFRRTHPIVSYFDGSVNGLRVGAQVKFKGIEVGTVDRISIPGGLLQTDQPIAVFYALDGDKLDDAGDEAGTWVDTLNGAIGNGLRAQLESDSLVTGVQHVSLVFMPESEMRLHERIDGALEIPTIPPELKEIGAALRSIVDRIGRYDFEGLLDSLKDALEGVGDLTRSPELAAAIASLGETLEGIDRTVARIEAQVDPVANRIVAVAERADAVGSELQAGIGEARATFGSVGALSDEVAASWGPLAESLRRASDRLQASSQALEATLASARIVLDPEAPIAVELRAGLREMTETARSTRALVELLERNPGALVRGRGTQPEEPR